MTRINLVDPKELCDQHLLAEWLDLFNKYGYNITTVLKEEHIYDSEGVLAAILKRV